MKIVYRICDECGSLAVCKIRVKMESLYLKLDKKAKLKKSFRGRSVKIGEFCEKHGDILLNSIPKKRKLKI